MRNGLTAQRVLVIVGVLGLVAAAGALASTALHNDLFAIIAAGGVVSALMAGEPFWHPEARLFHQRTPPAVRGGSARRGVRRPLARFF